MRSALALALAAGVAVSAAGPSRTTDDAAIVHLLNRVAFGPRPGDVERVRAMGIDRYLDQQLHPERVADPSMALRLAGLSTIGMSTREIGERFERPLLEARQAKK